MTKIDKMGFIRRRMEELDMVVHKDDFLDAFKEVLNFVKKIEAKNKKEVDAMKTLIKEVVRENLSGLNRNNITDIKSIEAKIEKRLAEVRDGVDGQAGKDADEEDVIRQVMARLDTPTKKELKTIDSDLDGAYDMIDKLKKKIKKLEKDKPLFGRGGGGFSKIHMDRHFIMAETPTGTINSTNKVFTIANTPNPEDSLIVYLDGQRMQLTTDYTLSGRTITFGLAPPTGSILMCDYRK